MGILFLIAIFSFAINAAAQLAQTTTTDANKKPIYVAGASTSSVAAPAFTPTLVYNCYYMPLICENVANFAKSVNPNGGGDLAASQIFYFDPSDAALTSRRRKACGCFDHDGCTTANSQGKTNTGVVAIAGQAPFNTLNTPLSQANQNIILAGTNPSTDKNGVLQPRVPLQSVPGRFYGVNGVAFSCDEFPPATFIEGGVGDGTSGSRAKTICAMSNWKLYTAQNSPGKWPFASGSGSDREQDWQGKSHNLLRNALNVGSKANKRGWGTVYPFSFTTTTLQAQVQTKAYVVRAAAVTKAVMKRDGTPTTTTYIATTTLNVFGDEEPELRHRDYDADDWRQYGTGEERMDLSLPGLRVRQALAPASTSGFSTIGSSQTSNFTTLTSSSSNSMVSPSTSGSMSAPSSGSAASTVTPSTLTTVQISSSSGSASLSTAGSASTFLGASSATVSSGGASGSSVSGTLTSASASASVTLGSQSATAPSVSGAGSSLTGTLPSATVSSVTASSAGAGGSSLTGTFSSISASGSTIGNNSSASSLSVTTLSATATLGTSLSASGQSNTASSGASTITGSSGTFSSGSGLTTPAASITQSSGAVVAGNPVATSSASAVSSKVASASSAAALLVANPSNKQYAQTAQKAAHDAKNAAAAMLSLAIGGSPLAGALSSLVGILGTAAGAADAAVDATTPAGVSAAAADLVSDLADAAKDAEEVKEDSEDDDDDEPSNSPSASEAKESKASEASKTKPSSQSHPSTIPSASITASSSGSVSQSASSKSKASSGSISSSASSQSRSSSQSSASATPTQCTLTFYVDGDEDPEVGDDYDDLDDDSGNDGVCNPILGPGGSIVPCGASSSVNATSGAVPGTSFTSSHSGSARSVLPTSLTASSTRGKDTTGASSAASSPPKSTQSSTPPKSTPSSTPPKSTPSSTPPKSTPSSTPPKSTPSSTPPAKSSTPPPPPPPPATTSTPPPPPSTPPAPPTPSQTSSNNKGSALCASIGGTTCQIAYSQYNDTYLYTAYTSYILPSGDNSVINDLFAPFADDGCAAMFTCNNDADYAVGMTGEQIKDAFDNLYKNDKVKVCGSSYLSNGCHVTVNGCDNCKPGVPCGSLDAANIANKYPCYT